MAQSILDHLNEAQKAAVLATEGPVMVIAGAGSGKTRVLTFRVAWLLGQGVDPFRILALTFTNKAAREMKDRIINLVGGTEAHSVWMGTFHSIFARVLRVEGHLLGYPPNYTIYDTDDSKRVIRNLVKENNLDDKVYQHGYVLHRISSAKTSLLSANEYNNNPEVREYDTTSGKPLTGQLYTQYQNRLKRAAAMDFDDLLFNMNILLRDFPDVLYKYQQKFRYILVDEYQDTNYAQYLIIKKLAANNENICVVGDDAQSIYAFRGANIQNILNFRKDYPDLQTFKLEQNYRSTKTIVAAANSVIENNKQQIFKKVWTENEEGGLIRLIRASSDAEEGNLVAQSIFELKMNFQLPNDAFAILYRTNAQSRSLEDALRRLNIPCRVYGGISFYQRKEIKDMLAYFRLAINPRDEEALLRVINVPARGIGKTTIEKLIVAADDSGSSIYEVIGNPEGHHFSLPSGTMQKIMAFLTMIRSFGAMLKTRNAYDLGKHIAASSGLLKDLYEDKTPEGVSHYENIEELLNGVKEFTESERAPNEETGEIDTSIRTLDEFMQEVSLLTDADYKDEKSKDRVLLMTVHAAKGLEFPHVFIVGLEENLFPSIQSLNSRADLEEERRLFYVALTRAQKSVAVSYAQNRYRWGNLTICEPSRFISELPQEQLDLPKKASVNPGGFFSDDNFSASLPGLQRPKKIGTPDSRLKKARTTDIPDDFNAARVEAIVPGIEVLHELFGKGKVVQVDGEGPNKKATVFFQGVGQKQLLLKFARLKLA